MKISCFARIFFYEGPSVDHWVDVPFQEGERLLEPRPGLALRLHMSRLPALSLRLTAVRGTAEQIGAGLLFRLQEWGRPNYLLMPGAVYNGNRFPVYPCAYEPFRYGNTDLEQGNPEMIADIPHLSQEGGSIQFHAGDLSEPAVGLVCGQDGVLLWTEQKFGEYESGISIKEHGAEAEAVFSVPSVKESKYRITKCGCPSDDRAPDLKPGQSLSLTVWMREFPCPDIQTLFDALFSSRMERRPGETYRKEFPFGSCARVLEEKFNRTDWVEEYGYYSMGPRPGYERAWILGWPGMMVYPMLLNGSGETKTRALRNIQYILRETQAPGGLFYASAGGRDCFGDCFAHRDWKNWGLLRRNCDALYYLSKCYLILEREPLDFDLPALKASLLRCGEAFVRLFAENEELGQFVDVETNKILIGATSSAALAVGALALCGAIFERTDFIRSAEQIAEYYVQNYLKKGITNGGPGEILQAPDSESAYGLTAGLVTLYQVTGKEAWLQRAGEAARQFATWCMPYNYRFPSSSEFGRLDMKTVGTVFANAQNKHSAPGICTHSGVELLQLYRYTGDRLYLELVREIAGTIPQYLSRAERPVHASDGRALPHGWMHERVNTSDWEGTDHIGQVWYGNCWCSVSLMMTCAEIPGVYVCRGTDTLCAIDHVNASWSRDRKGLIIENPTAYDTEVTVWDDRGKSEPFCPALGYRRVQCPAGRRIEIELER